MPLFSCSMSQIPLSQQQQQQRRAPLSLTQPPKVKKTPVVAPSKSSSGSKAIDLPTTPVVDPQFPEIMDNAALINMLDNAADSEIVEATAFKNGKSSENGSDPAPNPVAQKKSATEDKAPEMKDSPRKSKVPVATKANQAVVKDAPLNASTVSKQSLATEKECLGFDEEGFEMESILIRDDDEEEDEDDLPLKESMSKASPVKPVVVEQSVTYDSPRPNKTTPGSTKVVRLAKGMHPFRKLQESASTLDNVSTVVNLSTVSEQSVEASGSEASSPFVADASAGASSEDAVKSTASGVRRMAPRRTYNSRPLREISYRNSTIETYRRLSEFISRGCDDGPIESPNNDSTNVTVGSDLNRSLDNSPVAGQKRRASNENDSSFPNQAQPPTKRGLFQSYCSIM